MVEYENEYKVYVVSLFFISGDFSFSLVFGYGTYEYKVYVVSLFFISGDFSFSLVFGYAICKQEIE